MWKKETTEFGKFCIAKVGEEDSDIVYKVYREIIQFDSKGKTRDVLLKLQKDHINYLLSQVTKEILVAAVKHIKLDKDSGVLTEPFKKASSFRNFVLKYNPDYSSKAGFGTTASVPEQKQVKYTIPVKHIRAFNDFKDEDEFLNWHYKCTACNKGIYDAWASTCPSCGAIVQWEKRDKNV